MVGDDPTSVLCVPKELPKTESNSISTYLHLNIVRMLHHFFCTGERIQTHYPSGISKMFYFTFPDALSVELPL